MKECVIELQDHKNMRLIGVDPTTRRKCVNKLKFKIPQARYIPAVRLGRWDGTVSLCSIGGNTYINLLPDIYEILVNNDYNVTIKDSRIQNNFEIDSIDENIFSNFKWPDGKFADENIVMMDHQVNAVNELIKNDSATIVASTSSGKTLICAALCKQVEHHGRTVTIVPNRDLVDQTYETYKMVGLDAGRIYSGIRELTNEHIITTWQSLNSIKKKSKEQLTEEELAQVIYNVKMVIQDETHLAAANVLFEINSKIFRDVPKSYGMTGTIPKDIHLRESIRANFGEVVYTIPAIELQDKGILAKCDIQLHQVIYDKMYSEYTEEKKALSNDSRIIEMISNDIIELTGKDKSNTLVLVENIDTGELLQQSIPNSIFLYGSINSKKRKEEYKSIADEDDKVIIATYGIASTGISINRLFNLILYNPGKSFTRVIQSIGRGLRIAEDKDFVAIRDYSFTTKYSKKHLTERKKYYKESSYPFTIVKRSIQ